EEQAARTPDRIALRIGETRETREKHEKRYDLSYKELNEKSNQLARLLRRKGVKAGTIVGIMIERSVEMVVGIQAILKAGGAYLPIDPEYPDNRILSMLDISKTSVLLTTSRIYESKSLPAVAGQRETRFLRLDKPGEEPAGESRQNLEPVSGPGDLIYIIFTSGSTGNPKGAGVYHRGFLNLMFWFVTEFELAGQDSNLFLTSLSFDLTQKNLYASLMKGGTICLPPVNHFEPAALLREIRRHRVTWINCTPSMFYKLVEHEESAAENHLGTLRYVFLGGEPISLTTLIRWLESDYHNAQIVNTYGPTECTDICASYRVTPPRRFLEEIIPVGYPVYNVQLYVSDKNLCLQPVGVPGELLIGGEGVGTGYVNDKALTSRKFTRFSFDAGKPRESGQLLYRTGDLVKWRPDGTVEFIGRIDHQVKIRGYRIELGEIESLLLAHPRVKEAIVPALEGEGGDKYLCAYIVAEGAACVDNLREYLSAELPDYMVPSYFVVLDKMPLNPNGKVDRKALPAPDVTRANDYVPPRNETEILLVKLWAVVLGLAPEHIGIRDNFFRLGGHSLKAVTLTSRIYKVFSVEVPIGELLKKPTVESIAHLIHTAEGRSYSAVRPVEKRDYYVVSSAQKRLFVVHGMDPGNVTYNIPAVLAVEGKVEKERFEAAFKRLIHRHESLRTSFKAIDGQPVQLIHDNVEFKIEYLATKEVDSFIRPFDLSCPPLLRVGLAQTGEDRHLLVFDMHHIVSDGVSAALLVKEFMTLYRGETLPPLPLQYRDFTLWQNDLTGSGVIKKQGVYWQGQLEGDIPLLNLPTDFPRPAVQQFAGNSIPFNMEEKETEASARLALETGSTLYMVLFAVFNLFLSKLTGREDIVVGTPVAGRRHPDLENIIGMFVNILPVRTRTFGPKPFTEFLQAVRDNLFRAFENQDYQYEELLETVDVERDLSRNPLYDTVFVLQNMESRAVEIPGLTVTPLEYDTRTAKFDLTLHCTEVGKRLQFRFEYGTRLFEESTVRRFTGFFKKIISDVLENPGIPLSRVEIIPEAEKRRVLVDFNDTAGDYPREKTIHRLFEEQAEKNPDKIAVVYETRAVTYNQLDRRGGNLAARLRQRGVDSDVPVGLMVERSLEMVVGIIGILKAGGAYLPINPDFPEERKRYMLEDSNAGVLLSELSKVSELSELSGNVEVIQSTQPTHLSYIMYTSGSTGIPRGVMVEHRNVVRLVKNTNFVEFRFNDRILQTGALEFDASTFEIWGALLNGLILCLVEKRKILTPRLLKRVMLRYDITTIWMTSPLFNQVVEADIEIFGGLTNLLVGGDILSPSHINRLRERYPGVNIINGYGPTENTTFSTTFLIDGEYEGSIPIGVPIANSTAYIVDRYGNLQPPKVPGELVVGGDGVARGYLNNPELTNSKFQITNYNAPLTSAGTPGSYKTGDRARWLPDGTIEFLGRIDHQVKIRGFRVELGEIESRLLKIEGVKEAVVIVKAETNREKYLCAYTAPAGKNAEELKALLSKSLPNYMVPAYFISLEKMPLNPNGKIDRNALPEPETVGRIDAEGYTAPRDELELRLARLWGKLLAVPSVGIYENFFDIGGHSLKALHLLNALQKEFHVKIDFQDIFLYPTIASLSDVIRNSETARHSEIPELEEKNYYELSFAQKRLWLLHEFAPEDPAFNLPVRITLTGTVETAVVRKVFEALAERHDAFRTYFKRVKGEPVQFILPPGAHRVNLETVDISHLNESACALRRTRLFHEESTHPFTLDRPPLYRGKLIKCRDNEHDILLTMHHIITDGWSMEVLEQEFHILYNARKPGGGEEPLKPLPLRYRDYAAWHNRLLSDSEGLRAARAFWETQLSGERVVLDLPYDFPAADTGNRESSAFRLVVPETVVRDLKTITAENKVSLFMVLLAAYNMLLSRIAGQEEILLAIPGAARQHDDLRDIVGLFVNTLILKNRVYPGETFVQLLERVRGNMLRVLDNQSYPLELICKEFKLRYPEISVFFNMSIFGSVFEGNLEDMDSYPIDRVQNAKFDIVSYVGEYKNAVEVTTHYLKGRFKPVTVERMMRMYLAMLDAISRDPGKPLKEYFKTKKKRKIAWT
ncbi:MAG: amino acid adenylation domain-containing protein, partial [bacterium]|nr:amino acid adenylation domain-containing protein [bacterium]